MKICEVLDLSADYVLTGNGTNRIIDSIAEKLVGLSEKELRMVREMIDYMKSIK